MAGGNYDFLATKYIVVDVTPEKRYAIWNDSHQRFLTLSTLLNQSDKTQVQIEMEEWKRNNPQYKYYVVEFDYPGESE